MYGLLFLLFFAAAVSAASATVSFPDRFTASSHPCHKFQEYFELSPPLPFDPLPPSCSRHVISHSFANTINGPPYSVRYSPPPPSKSFDDCSFPWSHIALDFRAKSKGEQYDRIAGLWLGGVELLRTSTAEPTKEGIFWKVRKDITKYSSLLSRSDLNLTLMLENVVDRVFTAVYHVKVHFHYYKQNAVVSNPRVSPILPDRKSGAVVAPEEPADLIVPISDSGDRGFWFRIDGESDYRTKQIKIPRNTRRVVLELYVSFHGDDEFWYSNPPSSYITTNHIPTGRGNGAYREVFVTIDGELVGSEVPFPVVFTGGINPLFWGPVVAIGAFNLPSYDIDLTPFLGKLLDKKAHSFGIGVSDGISYWLVNANLHIWLDHGAKIVKAKSRLTPAPAIEVKRKAKFKTLDGRFKIKALRMSSSVGWVKTSSGNFTTTFRQRYKYRNSISFEKNGTYKTVRQKLRAVKEVMVVNEVGAVVLRTRVEREYPILVTTATLPGSKKDRYVLVTNVTHSMEERSSRGGYGSRVSNMQVSRGWMEVKDHDVLSGTADTRQSFSYKDEFGCYMRAISAVDGSLIMDNSSFRCLSAL